jgi:hypothetical protein
VIVVTIAYIRRLTLHRSHTHVLYCAAGRAYVVKPKENGYAQGLHIDVMV